MRKSTLKSAADVVEALGGPAAVARRLRRSPQQVCNWKADGLFPTWTDIPLKAALKAAGYAAPHRLWRKLEDAMESLG